MSTDSAPDVQLEIGHVLFMDVVGYPKLLINDQRELQDQLSEIVRGTNCFRSAEAAGRLIRLDSVVYSITVNDLKYRWEWDPIRNDLGFQKLVNAKP